MLAKILLIALAASVAITCANNEDHRPAEDQNRYWDNNENVMPYSAGHGNRQPVQGRLLTLSLSISVILVVALVGFLAAQNYLCSFACLIAFVFWSYSGLGHGLESSLSRHSSGQSLQEGRSFGPYSDHELDGGPYYAYRNRVEAAGVLFNNGPVNDFNGSAYGWPAPGAVADESVSKRSALDERSNEKATFVSEPGLQAFVDQAHPLVVETVQDPSTLKTVLEFPHEKAPDEPLQSSAHDADLLDPSAVEAIYDASAVNVSSKTQPNVIQEEKTADEALQVSSHADVARKTQQNVTMDVDEQSKVEHSPNSKIHETREDCVVAKEQADSIAPVKKLVIPWDLTLTFITAVKSKDIDVIGYLLGHLRCNDSYVITKLYIPPQSVSDHYEARDADSLGYPPKKDGLSVLGWIRRDATNICAWSFCDCHRQYEFQKLQNSFLGIVISPELHKINFFSLTEKGMNSCKECTKPFDAAHTHSDKESLYRHTNHFSVDHNFKIELVDRLAYVQTPNVKFFDHAFTQNGMEKDSTSLDVKQSRDPTSDIHDANKGSFLDEDAASFNVDPLVEVMYPLDLHDMFLKAVNDRDTVGYLLGKEDHDGRYVVSVLYFPVQSKISNTDDMVDAESLDYPKDHNLIVLGWIRLDPTESCYPCTDDLHFQCEFQKSQSSSVGILVAPKSKKMRFFALTNKGLQSCRDCTDPFGAYHIHPDQGSLYHYAHHWFLLRSLTVTLVDDRATSKTCDLRAVKIRASHDFINDMANLATVTSIEDASAVDAIDGALKSSSVKPVENPFQDSSAQDTITGVAESFTAKCIEETSGPATLLENARADKQARIVQLNAEIHQLNQKLLEYKKTLAQPLKPKTKEHFQQKAMRHLNQRRTLETQLRAIQDQIKNIDRVKLVQASMQDSVAKIQAMKVLKNQLKRQIANKKLEQQFSNKQLGQQDSINGNASSVKAFRTTPAQNVNNNICEASTVKGFQAKSSQ